MSVEHNSCSPIPLRFQNASTVISTITLTNTSRYGKLQRSYQVFEEGFPVDIKSEIKKRKQLKTS
jgi:hypothetical protein